MKDKKIKFEKALNRLEEIVETMEGGELELEKSLEIFDEGIKMAGICRDHLDQAEKKIEKLIKDHKGKLTTKAIKDAPRHDDDAGEDDVPF